MGARWIRNFARSGRSIKKQGAYRISCLNSVCSSAEHVDWFVVVPPFLALVGVGCRVTMPQRNHSFDPPHCRFRLAKSDGRTVPWDSTDQGQTKSMNYLAHRILNSDQLRDLQRRGVGKTSHTVDQCNLSAGVSAGAIMTHRALAVDEILREVAAHVTDVHPSTAVSLACCARSFEEPALSALWKIQDELPTLVKTLPPDSWDFLPLDPSGEKKIVRVSPRPMALNLCTFRV